MTSSTTSSAAPLVQRVTKRTVYEAVMIGHALFVPGQQRAVEGAPKWVKVLLAGNSWTHMELHWQADPAAIGGHRLRGATIHFAHCNGVTMPVLVGDRLLLAHGAQTPAVFAVSAADFAKNYASEEEAMAVSERERAAEDAANS
jgi:hypothetical protein